MNTLLEDILEELRDRNAYLGEVYAPYYMASMACHLFNLHNQKHKIYWESSNLPSMRLHLLFVAPPGFMKCLSRTTNLWTDDGLVEIGKIKPDDMVLTPSGYRRVVKTKTMIEDVVCRTIGRAKNRELVGTPEHPMWTGERWEPLVSAHQLARWKPAPPTLDRKSILLGMLLGDGHLGLNDLTITKGDKNVINLANEISKQEFDIGLVHRNRLEYSFSWGIPTNKANPVRQWIRDLGLWGSRSRNKFIPEEYKNLSTVYGLYLTDFGKTQYVCLNTSSRQLRDDVVDVLREAKINPRVYKQGETWSLRLTKPEEHKLMSLWHSNELPPLVLGKSRWEKDVEVVDIQLEGEHSFLLEDWTIAHNTYFLETMIRGKYCIIGDTVRKTFEAMMTEAGLIGTIGSSQGEIYVEEGAAKEFADGIIGVDEFSAITRMMQTTHSGLLDVQLLSLLDSGKAYKRLAHGKLEFDSQLSLWGGVQPSRYDLTSGMGRRFCFLLFLPTRADSKELLDAWYKSKNKRPNIENMERIWTRLKVFKQEIEGIKELEFDPHLLQDYQSMGIYPYEGTLFDRLILGMTLLNGGVDEKVYVTMRDPAIRAMVNQEITWRRHISIGGELRQVIRLIEDQGGKILRSKLMQDCFMLGWDLRKMVDTLKEMEKLKLISITREEVLLI